MQFFFNDYPLHVSLDEKIVFFTATEISQNSRLGVLVHCGDLLLADCRSSVGSLVDGVGGKLDVKVSGQSNGLINGQSLDKSNSEITRLEKHF